MPASVTVVINYYQVFFFFLRLLRLRKAEQTCCNRTINEVGGGRGEGVGGGGEVASVTFCVLNYVEAQ